MPNYKNRTVGAIAANGAAVSHSLRALSPGQLAIQVTGTFVGTIEIEASLNGTNFAVFAVKDSVQTTATTLITSITAPKLLITNAYGLDTVRLRATAWTSGTADITIVNI
jgi:hypothetical protein